MESSDSVVREGLDAVSSSICDGTSQDKVAVFQVNDVAALACEVNFGSFNVQSQALHPDTGFVEVGRLQSRGMDVSLVAKCLV
ncbi:MAG: hypothetical protein CMO26_03025 [Thiotrichales bacterium]|nr:hypothetical protein [Thiotrichales bacterium]